MRKWVGRKTFIINVKSKRGIITETKSFLVQICAAIEMIWLNTS